MKNAQSAIISTILLIFIAVASTSLILSFTIPFTKNQLSKTECFEVNDKIEITNNPIYTCYDSANGKLRVQVHFLEPEEIHGIIIELDNSEVYEIKEGEKLNGVEMLEYQTAGDIKLDADGGYVLEDTFIYEGLASSNGDIVFTKTGKYASGSKDLYSLYKFDTSMFGASSTITDASLCMAYLDELNFQSSYPFYASYIDNPDWTEDTCLDPNFCDISDPELMIQLEFGDTLTENVQCYDITDVFALHKDEPSFTALFNAETADDGSSHYVSVPTKERVEYRDRIPHIFVEGILGCGGDCEILELPGKNEERTYKIATSVKPDSIKLYPILNEDICESYSEQEISLC